MYFRDSIRNRRQHFATLAVCLVTSLIALNPSSTANADSYFVQPIVGIGGGGLINGLEIDGATQRSEAFTLDVQSNVDLGEGEITGIVERSGAGQSAFSQGRFGERVTFNSGAGTVVDFSFAFEGTVDAEVNTSMSTSSQIIVDGYFAVFDSSLGADNSNWFDLGIIGSQAVISERAIFDWSGTTVDISALVDEFLSGSVVIGPGANSYDVFANLTLVGNTLGGLLNVSLDFLGTGTFGIDAEPGVTYTSASGVFLDATGVTMNPVPLPATLPLFAGGLGLLGLLGWRRKRRAAAI